MSRLIFSIMLAVLPFLHTFAQSSLIEQEAPSTAIESEMNLELRTPQVGPKLHTYIAAYMKHIGENLVREKYRVETMRQREVIIVTVPTDGMFRPNETMLYPSAARILNRFKEFITPDHKFKLIITAHSDDTGSEDYLFDLTEGRINAILDYYEAQGLSLDDIIGYPKADSEPVKPNTSIANRSANRRLEIYIVPNNGLISEARRGRK